MALKDLFKMTKADRYTADGCEELNKAREADVEDKVYQIGEISQKTGLQKTANGWVKPKNGKQPRAKENGPLSPAKRKAERIAKMQKETGKAAPYGRTLKGTPKTPDDNPLTERTQKRAEGSKPLQHTSASPKVQESVYKDIKNNGLEDYTVEEIAKEYGITRGDAEAIRATLNKDKLLDSLSFDLVDTTSDIEEEYNAVEHSDNSRLPEFVRQQVENEYVNKTNGEKWSDAEKDIIAEEVTRRIKERQSKDAAPRTLTGDTRLHLSQVKDKVYQIGEISQKTGLQKTANGWVKPKSGKPAENIIKEMWEKQPRGAGSLDLAEVAQKAGVSVEEMKSIVEKTDGFDVSKYMDKYTIVPSSESKPGRDRPALKKEDHIKLAKEVLSNTSATDPGWTAEEIAKEWKLGQADAEEVKKEFDNLRKGSSGNKPAAESKPEEQNKSAKQYSVENLPAVGSNVTFEGKINGKPIEGKGNVVGFITKNNKTYARVKTNEGSYDVNLSLLRGGRSGKDANKGKVITGNVEGKGGLWEPIYGEPQEDSAPRQLTGDCKIRVKK